MSPSRTWVCSAPLLAERGSPCATSRRRPTTSRREDPLAPDLLVVLGGPIGAYEEALYPFLATELRLLERRLAAGRPTLGLCLGAQLMARALGARVYPGARKEIGWGALSLAPAGKESCLRHLDGTRVLHWHGDTFDLPARRAAPRVERRSPQNQAFAWGARRWRSSSTRRPRGAALERWFVGHALEIAPTPGVTVEALRRDTLRCYARPRARRPRLLRGVARLGSPVARDRGASLRAGTRTRCEIAERSADEEALG